MTDVDARAASAAGDLDARLAAAGRAAWDELAPRRAGATMPALRFPAPFRIALSRALAIESSGAAGARSAGQPSDRRAALEHHYLEVLPRLRVAQLAGTDEPTATLFHTPLAWSQLPRLTGALARLFALLADEDAASASLGAPSLREFIARTPTLADLYARTHYGACMPLLYGYPADVAGFCARGAAAGLAIHGTIDRYLTAPLVHELAHFGRERAALPPHLDECVAGWLGVHVHPELAYPAAGWDDALYAAPWLAQVGQAIARAFGVTALVRAQRGDLGALPAEFVAAAARLADDDWRARRTLHLLSDTLEPRPWVALALAAAAGRPLTTLAELAAIPLHTLAIPEDAAFDRAIVGDALRAMCLATARIDHTFRVRSELPATIAIDARACLVTTARRGDVEPRAPSYWLPPAVGARLLARGIAGYTLRLETLAAIDAAAPAICDGAAAHEGFALIALAT